MLDQIMVVTKFHIAKVFLLCADDMPQDRHSHGPLIFTRSGKMISTGTRLRRGSMRIRNSWPRLRTCPFTFFMLVQPDRTELFQFCLFTAGQDHTLSSARFGGRCRTPRIPRIRRSMSYQSICQDTAGLIPLRVGGGHCKTMRAYSTS
jgi:hypothetical protein